MLQQVPIAYDLLKNFRKKYPEWFVEKKVPDNVDASEEELRELKPMPFLAMVASVRSNDESDMYQYLGGVKNSITLGGYGRGVQTGEVKFPYCNCCRYVDDRI